MSKNPVNDNGLSKNIPESVQLWYHLNYKIKKLKKQQDECIKDMDAEYKSAKELGYTDDEISKLIGTIMIYNIGE